MINKDTSSFEAHLPKSVSAALSSVAAKPIKFDSVNVKFDVKASTLTKYAQSLSESFAFHAKSQALADKLTHSVVSNYLGILLCLRISNVNQQLKLDTRRYRDATPFPAVPSFFSLFLENVGSVTDVELGVELVPTVEHTDFDLITSVMEPDQFREVSNLMKTFAKEGFEFVDTLPRDRRGSWEMMAMTFVSDRSEICRHDGKVHMVYALMASLCEQTHATTPLLPRVTYGPTSYLSGLLQEFGRFK